MTARSVPKSPRDYWWRLGRKAAAKTAVRALLATGRSVREAAGIEVAASALLAASQSSSFLSAEGAFFAKQAFMLEGLEQARRVVMEFDVDCPPKAGVANLVSACNG